jgi:hypothetical protein
MRLGIILFIACLSCKPKISNQAFDKASIDTIDNSTKIELISEDFKNFFSKFKSDSLFQIQRIDNPISVIISDEESEEEEKQDVKYVSFNQKDWDVKIELKTNEESKDTMNVILEGKDTGIHIEHLFVKRNDKWYLFQIKNLSD